MSPRASVVIGSGVFGVTAALALVRRGWRVILLDPGPVPHPLAASTDISKVVRLDYGTDETYTTLMELALPRWRSLYGVGAEPAFHQTGIVFLRRTPLEHGGLEHASYEFLRERGHPLQRLGRDAIARRFPAWNSEVWLDGYLNPAGGYAESTRVMGRLVDEARTRGVELRPGVGCARLLLAGDRVTGVVQTDGAVVAADTVVVAAGAWTPHLLADTVPEVKLLLRPVGQPVFHLRPADPGLFYRDRFPVFGAELAVTGYYGFPATADGIVKVARHGPGRSMAPEAPDRAVTAEEEAHLRAFLRESLPRLAEAPLCGTRVCMYCDTPDGDFLIGRSPGLSGLVVSAGDSGHGFKFAPVLGDLIADAVEKDPTELSPALRRFAFRPPRRGNEVARASELPTPVQVQ